MEKGEFQKLIREVLRDSDVSGKVIEGAVKMAGLPTILKRTPQDHRNWYITSATRRYVKVAGVLGAERAAKLVLLMAQELDELECEDVEVASVRLREILRERGVIKDASIRGVPNREGQIAKGRGYRVYY